MTRTPAFPPEALMLVAAPMVDASDFPFRLMCIKGGATATYTQMYLPEKLFADEEYRERALRDLQYEKTLPKQWRRPVIVQLGGRDMARMVEAAQLFAPHCDGIDINCGCPQEPAMLGGYGSALLIKKEWDHLEQLVKSVVCSISIPVSVKIRLCSPVSDTLELAQRLEAVGISHIALHARFPSAKHRRHGPAKLEHVKELAESLNIPVLSNGNIRCHADLSSNLATTESAGLMVGEELMRNPYLFAGQVHDPFALTTEYLDTCAEYPGSATIKAVRQHIRYFYEQAHLPKAWSGILKKRLGTCETLEDVRTLVTALQPLLQNIVDC